MEKTKTIIGRADSGSIEIKKLFYWKKNDYRITGRFPEQQEKTLDKIFERRMQGKSVSVGFIGRKMKEICNQETPPGYNAHKNKFGDNWRKKFMKRHDLSFRQKTNVKKESIPERMHKLHNYHFYSVYKMGLDPISSASESESGSEMDSEDSDTNVINDFGSGQSASESHESESDSDST